MSVCRECADGKHQNYDGTAWDNAADGSVPCLCDDPAHVVLGLTQSPLDDALYHAREELTDARIRLDELIISACSSHELRQHRDGLPPWCEHCYRTADGIRVPRTG